MDGKILAEREQLHKESTIEKGKHQDAEKVMKESFAQQQEVAMWNIQQKHWDAQEVQQACVKHVMTTYLVCS